MNNSAFPEAIKLESMRLDMFKNIIKRLDDLDNRLRLIEEVNG